MGFQGRGRVGYNFRVRIGVIVRVRDNIASGLAHLGIFSGR